MAPLETVCKAKQPINTGVTLILGAALAGYLATSRQCFTYKKCPIGKYLLPVWPQIHGGKIGAIFRARWEQENFSILAVEAATGSAQPDLTE